MYFSSSHFHHDFFAEDDIPFVSSSFTPFINNGDDNKALFSSVVEECDELIPLFVPLLRPLYILLPMLFELTIARLLNK